RRPAEEPLRPRSARSSASSSRRGGGERRRKRMTRRLAEPTPRRIGGERRATAIWRVRLRPSETKTPGRQAPGRRKRCRGKVPYSASCHWKRTSSPSLVPVTLYPVYVSPSQLKSSSRVIHAASSDSLLLCPSM